MPTPFPAPLTHRRRSAAAWLCLLAAGTLASVAQADERREGAVHLHGISALNLALEGSQLVIELEGPAMNFIGFEHRPASPEQTAALEQALALLAQPGRLLGIPAAAGCELQESAVESPDYDHHEGHDDHADHDHDHDHEHEHEHEHEHDQVQGQVTGGVHSELGATWTFRCTSPAQLTAIEVHVFTRFPLTEEINAVVVTPDLQTRQLLTPARATLRLTR